MADAHPEQPLADMTVRDLERLVRRVVREERRGECFLEDDGTLVFYREPDYARYLKHQKNLPPSRVGACFVDGSGFRFRYSDFTLKSGKRRELLSASPGARKRVAGEEVWHELRGLGVDV